MHRDAWGLGPTWGARCVEGTQEKQTFETAILFGVLGLGSAKLSL